MPRRKNAPQGAYPRAYPDARRDDPLADCPMAAAFAAVGGKWKLTILYWLAHEEHHFSGLLRRLAPISHKVLTAQLRELERSGLVERQVVGPVPAPVHYRLTDYGNTVLPLVECARLWGLEQLRRTRPEALANAGTSFTCEATLRPA